ncbi:DASH family cryptochrome [Pontibacter sp. G13]|uniref:DASH family cryptochrome n=1 Tax=Pontibacter sp. G13 TaxID=3074898 RepID=UPI00288A1AAB|nr:DASH family cryptochrome [Pontibacter sp. G13]WNJ18669.1 DASH family cryptochrome [Pontibacter sp. G13]
MKTESIGKRGLLWLRYDLRVRDHEPLINLTEICELGFAVFVLDDRWFQQLSLGFDRMGPFRLKFLRETLVDIRSELAKLGIPLVILQGNPPEVVANLVKTHQITDVFFHEEMGWDERQDEETMSQAVSPKIRIHVAQGNFLVHPKDLPFAVRETPKTFTQFRKKVERRNKFLPAYPIPHRTIQPLLDMDQPMPELLKETRDVSIHPQSAFPYAGGERSAWQRVKHYFWDTDQLFRYKITRNGMEGTEYSSKLSPWLAWGSISAKSIYLEVKAYEAERKKNDSTYWLIFELLWRDFFRYTALKHGAAMFRVEGIHPGPRKWRQTRSVFEQWREGTTGQPFIDANMRELLQTGWMSNRGRQNVASYLTKDLGIDWRWGAWWFERNLIDYDVASNWGNWMYQAGVGNDPIQDRRFNPVSQAQRYDPKGDFQRLWLGQSTAR